MGHAQTLLCARRRGRYRAWSEARVGEKSRSITQSLIHLLKAGSSHGLMGHDHWVFWMIFTPFRTPTDDHFRISQISSAQVARAFQALCLRAFRHLFVSLGNILQDVRTVFSDFIDGKTPVAWPERERSGILPLAILDQAIAADIPSEPIRH